MSQFTKKAIVESFLELLNERDFDKITVTDIVDKCGINRNTFYYYFQDIYDLIKHIFSIETERINKEQKRYDSWQESFFHATTFARENKRAIFHLYNSNNKRLLQQYLFDVVLSNMIAYMKEESADLKVNEADTLVLSEFYSHALVGFLLQWLDTGMQEDAYERIKRLGDLLDGNIRNTLAKANQKEMRK